MAKINDTTTFPNTTPALTDHVPGTDVSNTGNDADGETVTFTLQAIMDLYEANFAAPADFIDAITEIAASLKTGADGTLVTGTEGTDGNLAMWNSDGDAVDSTVAASDVLVAGSKTGSDSGIVSGTAGDAGDVVVWDANGDAVEGTAAPSGAFVGTTDTQTLTNKTIAMGDATGITNTVTIAVDSATDWDSNDPTLGEGIIGYETDTGLFKVGDGSTAWTSLAYTAINPTAAQNLTNKTLTSAILSGTTTLGGNITMGGAYGIGFIGSNTTGGTLTKGTPVYLNGGSLSIDEADANGSGTMPCVGIVASDIANSASGPVIVMGFISGLNTASYTTYDALYVSETAGALTNAAPSSNRQEVARVTTVHASSGVILVGLRENSVPANGYTNSEAIVSGDLVLFGNASDSYDLYSRTFANLLLDLGVSGNLGTRSSGTETLAFSMARLQRMVNGGGFTLDPPSSGEGTIALEITNNSSAGTITTSNFDSVTGDSFDTTDGNKFLCMVISINGENYLIVNAHGGNS